MASLGNYLTVGGGVSTLGNLLQKEVFHFCASLVNIAANAGQNAREEGGHDIFNMKHFLDTLCFRYDSLDHNYYLNLADKKYLSYYETVLHGRARRINRDVPQPTVWGLT